MIYINIMLERRVDSLNGFIPYYLTENVGADLVSKYGWEIAGQCFITNSQLVCDAINNGSNPAEKGTRRPLLKKAIGENYVIEIGHEIEILKPFDWWDDDQTYSLSKKEARVALSALGEVEAAMVSGEN